jgi:hypothetical protein
MFSLSEGDLDKSGVDVVIVCIAVPIFATGEFPTSPQVIPRGGEFYILF